MPKSIEINIKKTRYEGLLDQTEKDLKRIIKTQKDNRDKMIASILELGLAFVVYKLIVRFGEQEYAGAILAPFTFIAKLMCIALVIRVIYHAIRLFIAKHPVENKIMSCNRVIDELKKDCEKYKGRIEEIKREYEDALEEEADEREVSLNQKIKDFEKSRTRVYSFYEDMLSPEEERARWERENAPSELEKAIMRGMDGTPKSLQ